MHQKKILIYLKKLWQILNLIINMVYIAVAAAAVIFAIAATVTYFEKSNPVSVEMANQTYDKFEDYVLEHYTNSYAGPSAQASVISVNFEK